MMENKKVSVIIPFYSGVEWLGEAVQSVLDQTYKNVEIIVINDGSPENIQPFLDKYGGAVVYRWQENQGPAVARNLALSIATGEYFAYEDADDVWLPTKLEKQITFMEENGFIWSHTGFFYWWPKTDKTKRVRNNNDYDDISRQMKISFKMVTPSVVVHRRTLEEHPEIVFPVELRKGQDSVYFNNLAKYYKVALIEEPLVKIRMRGDNSNGQVLMRFEKRANYYHQHRHDKTVPYVMQITGWMYSFYNKLFGTKRGRVKEFFAKCCWALPFAIDRCGVAFIIRHSKKDEHYIKRWK